MALRCVYTDLDGTLLGKYGSLFRDSEGGFSMLQARALEACHRAGVEVVIMSGRREAQVLEDARLIGQTSYIYEAGCGVMIDGEKTVLAGDSKPTRTARSPSRSIARGHPAAALRPLPGRLEWHTPWHTGRELSLLLRGKVDVEEANEMLGEHGHEDLRLLDNGAIGRPMEGDRGPGPRLPPDAAGGEQGERGRLPHARPRLRTRGVHRDRRLGRGPRGRARRRPLLRGRQRPRARPRVRAALAGSPT